MENINKKSLILYKMIIVALFASLSCIGTQIKIPVPNGSVHLGNFFCVLSGLLNGGLIGGLSGSLGMALADVFTGQPIPTLIRTIVVKFIYGFVAGFFFRFILKRKLKPFTAIATTFFISTLMLISCLVLYFLPSIKFSIIAVIFSSVFFVAILVDFIIFSIKKISPIFQILSLSVIIATFCNMFGEFIFIVATNTLLNSSSLNSSIVYGLSKLPSRIITGTLTTVLVLIIFLPLYNAIKGISRINDLNEYIN